MRCRRSFRDQEIYLRITLERAILDFFLANILDSHFVDFHHYAASTLLIDFFCAAIFFLFFSSLPDAFSLLSDVRFCSR